MAAESFRYSARSLGDGGGEMSDLDAIVNRLIHEYKKSHAISDTPCVFQTPRTTSERVGAYNLETVHETAEQLLLSLKKDKAEKAAEAERLEVAKPPLLIVAQKRGSFTVYLNGFKGARPIFGYSELLAQQFRFDEAEKITATLGERIFCLPAPESRMRAPAKGF